MKKVLVIGTLGIAALLVLGRNKLRTISTALKDLSVRVNGINNLQFLGNSIGFDLDIDLINNSPVPLDVNTFGAVSLRRLIFKDQNGNVIGESYPNISNINIPGQTSTRFESIPTSVPISNLGIATTALIQIYGNPSLLTIIPEFETPTGVYLLNG